MKIKIKKDSKQRGLTGILLILSLFVFSSLITVFKIDMLSKVFPYIYAVFCCWYLLKFVLTEYTYTFGEERFLVEKETSYKTVTFLDTEYENIISVKSEKSKGKNLTVGFWDKNSLTVTYMEKGKERKVRIHNNNDLILNFKRVLGDRFYE